MSQGLTAVYFWLKALHIIAVIAWMAGLLYLPRLFVYHAEAPHGSDRAATSGAVDWQRGWIWAKLALVVLLTAFHGLLEYWRRDFAARRYSHTARFYRIINELTTLAMIAIVILVVVKPF